MPAGADNRRSQVRLTDRSSAVTPWQQFLVRLARRWPRPNTLEKRLRAEGRTEWLEIGGKKFEQGFFCIGIGEPEDVPSQHRDRYRKLDILAPDAPLQEFEGRFDLVRMQHVFEHFSPEDGLDVLRVCHRMLKPGGYLLMSTPDLAIYVRAYRQRYRWAPPSVLRYYETRIPADAPPSFLFSMVAHQYGYSRLDHRGEQHCWCYDYEGLEYQVKRAGGFDEIRRLGLLHHLTSYPFTHNRMGREVCLLARKA
jgi:predicted SAM-dependent methyltransferase